MSGKSSKKRGSAGKNTKPAAGTKQAVKTEVKAEKEKKPSGVQAAKTDKKSAIGKSRPAPKDRHRPAPRAGDSGMLRLTVTLFAICAVCALVLGVVNMITEDRIRAVQKQKNDLAMAEVLVADSYEEVMYTGDDATVDAVYKAGDAGYVVQVSPSGSFSGTLTIMVGVNSDNTVSGVAVVKSGETSGLGDNAKKEDWRAQFSGLTGTVQVTKDGGTVEALTGATITSRAVSAGVTSALAAAAAMG